MSPSPKRSPTRGTKSAPSAPAPTKRARDAWARLRDVAATRDARGRTSLVPVLGAGFNAQATGKILGWRDLLVEVARDLRLSTAIPDGERIAGLTTLVWEAMLAELAARDGQQASRAENELQRHVKRLLAREYRVGGATRGLASRLASGRFRDVVSFNFDFGFHVESPRWSRRRPRGFDPVHDHALHASGARVWYPHGSVIDGASLQLGVRKYGLLVEDLELARRAHMRATRTRDAGSPASWIAATMSAPLVFLGMSLGREEWALWWFLVQRRRKHARHPASAPPVFVVMQEREAESLRPTAEILGLTLLTFPNGGYGEAWERVLGAVDASG